MAKIKTTKPFIPEKTISCFGGCGRSVEYKTNPRKYCTDCKLLEHRKRSKLSAENARRKAGVKKTKGVLFTCPDCGIEVVKKTSRHTRCGACALEKSKLRARDVSRDKCRKRGAPTKSGVERKCKHCGSLFVRRAIRHIYCDTCNDLPLKVRNPSAYAKARAGTKKWREENIERCNRVAAEKTARYRKSKPAFLVADRIRANLNATIRRGGYKKSCRTLDILGASDWREFAGHIERQFVSGMTWDNREKWHIDHIIPLASASTKQDVYELFHMTNLRPMWAEENIRKKDSIEFLI